MDNPFVLPTEEYGRDLNVLERYYQDTARYLALETGKSLSLIHISEPTRL